MAPTRDTKGENNVEIKQKTFFPFHPITIMVNRIGIRESEGLLLKVENLNYLY